MNIQERYWSTMVKAYFSCTYLELYYEQSVKRSRCLNIFLAIVSCGSIAGWAIWNHLSFMWAIIIAISQVFNAIKPYIPYSKRIDDLYKYERELCEVFNKLESEWYGVANGKYTEEEVNTLLIDSKQKSKEISNKYLYGDYLPRNEKYRELADKKTEEYFENNF